MYCVLALILAVLSLCGTSRPVQDAPASLDSGNPSMHLELPLSPSTEHDLQVRPSMNIHKGIPPERGHLVMSLAIEIYWYWRDEDNTPVTHPIVRQGLVPFQSLQYLIQPANNPETSLTPYKLGIACLWVMSYVLVQDISSGLVTAQISEKRHGLVGSIAISNLAQADGNAASSTTPPFDKELQRAFWPNGTLNSILRQGNQGAALRTGSDRERRWFATLSEMLQYIIKHSQFDLVVNTLPPAPKTPSSSGSSITYRFWRVPRDPRVKDYVDVTIHMAAVIHYLRWKQLVEELLILGSGVALGYSYSTVGYVRAANTVLAIIKITVADDGDETPAAA